ncbi:MAG: polysaccharide biosynthesis protein [Bacteroidales bacterium]|nr:polysaccharide biosynthesis protein [Bacteroidales bacterium]
MSNFLEQFERRFLARKATPHWIVMLADCLLVICSGLIVFTIEKGVVATITNSHRLLFTLLIYLIPFCIAFHLTKTYKGIIRYSTFTDILKIGTAVFVGASLTWALKTADAHYGFLKLIPISNICLFGTSTMVMVFMVLTRVLVKYAYEHVITGKSLTRVFIYGVKNGGLAIANSIVSSPNPQYKVVAFVTDNEKNVGHELMGCPIYLNDGTIADKMVSANAHRLLVSPNKLNDFRNNNNNNNNINSLINSGIKIMIVGQDAEWDGKNFNLNLLREVEVEDLLPRDEIIIDTEALRGSITDKCILITGAAGSIGSEIVRQVAELSPSRLVLVDQAETPLHDMRLRMARDYSYLRVATVTASVLNRDHMEKLFSDCHPDYVFHAAAFKHVPMMEDNPGESIFNNVLGTKIIADLAVKYGVKKFVMVSTDKAVNPTNVMGCSKRICEMYVQSLNKAVAEGVVRGETRFITTRFGNVLGSNGSVIHIFREQIRQGGPVTVTHPQIVRYFMLIPEACKLVLVASVYGKGGEIFVFDMGKPVKIADLAKRMINLSGADNVKIKYTGLREGEKLYEEVLAGEENTRTSFHDKILIAKVRELDYGQVSAAVDNIVELARTYNDMEIVKAMKALVPEYKSRYSKYEILDK